LANIFPENYGLSMDHMFLHFLQKKMPLRPWPKTVAGLPAYFAPETLKTLRNPCPPEEWLHRSRQKRSGSEGLGAFI
jgi:hypothetical protein